MADHGLTQEECARQVGKDRSSIANAIRILSLPSTVKDDLVNKKLSMGHARALAGLKSEAEVERIRQLIHRKALSVRQTELLCRSLKPGSEAAGKVRDAHPDLEYLAERLRSHLRTKVKLAGNPNRGKIEISFFGSSELERILSAIGYQ
jgi:ParB family chromosome partitioning protein